MRSALFGALLLALGLAGALPARAGWSPWCDQEDSHGRCLVCSFHESFTLHPGEIAQPFVCRNMARDPRVVLVMGGTGTVDGPPALRNRIGLRVWREGRRYGHVWGPNINTMPVGPVSIPIGRSRDGETVAPSIAATACGSPYGPAPACDFVLSGRICVTGQC